MMAGMIVVQDGEPWTVARIADAGHGWSNMTPVRTTYYLQRGTELKTVVNPKAVDVPLLPACPSCGRGAQPGQHGSAGWACAPSCPLGPETRAKLEA